MSDTDTGRPTREQVGEALRLANPSDHEAARPDALPRALAGFRILAAEVRALRDELDRMHSALRHEYGGIQLAWDNEHVTVEINQDQRLLAEYDRRGAVEKAAAAYVMAGLCGNPSTSAELTALIAAVRTNRDFHG